MIRFGIEGKSNGKGVAVKSGLVHLLCAEFKNNIRHLPVDEGQGRDSIKVHEASSLTAPDVVVGDVQVKVNF
ncbi:Sec24B protein [Culex quinquefasciatus]|uniref:Sec24B protein n=1 Tax=Culex quinquefasciatus TaxID=7176 RepID=B0WYZ8_CULQU|nr:Sec24B protein [Culex quinquefasciatus]|eukprot:XP_001862620.1 Sec24B protein [Culex quinquefasciatus]